MNKILLLLSASQGLLLSSALFIKILKKDYFRFFLGVIFFTISIEIWTYWGLKSNYINDDSVFPFWSLGSYLLLPPSIDAILKKLSREQNSNLSKSLWVLIPGILEILIKVSRFYASMWFQIELYNTDNYIWIFITQIFPIIWMVFILVRNFKFDSFSKKQFLVHSLFSLILALWITDFMFPGEIFIVIEAVLIGLLFGFGYVAYSNPRFFDPPKISKLDVRYGKLDDQVSISAYEKYIVHDQHFTKSGISLKDVADELKISAKYLSYVINKHFQMNFKNHLNQLRTKKVIEQISEQKHKKLTLLGIALEAGFNSKSSFNAIFKEQTGQTPTAFLKESEEKESKNQ